MSAADLSFTLNLLFSLLANAALFLQCINLYKLKSTKGFSTDFAIISFIGFSVLLGNQLVGFVDPYSPAGHVHSTDVLCFLGTFLFTAIQITFT